MNRRIDVFFYGLFMDSDVLDAHGVQGANPRKAYVENFALTIGHRATLLADPNAVAYGIVYSVTHVEIDKLYTSAGLESYKPEAVIANVLNQREVPALCFNLITPPSPEEVNTKYADKLKTVLVRNGFPEAYISSVR